MTEPAPGAHTPGAGGKAYGLQFPDSSVHDQPRELNMQKSDQTRPRTCVLTYVNGAYQGCGKCDACHDADTSAIEDAVRDGLMTGAQADLAHAENAKRFSGVFRYVAPAPAPEGRPAIDQPFQQEWEGDQ